MTSWQKTIKNLAYAFAIFLSIAIIGGICSAVASVFYLFDGSDNTVGEIKTYTVSDNIEKLKVENDAAVLSFVTGDEFKIESNNSYLTVDEKNGQLTVGESKRKITSYDDEITVTVYIPENTVFEKADITTGAGKVTVESLSADKLELELGAGEVTVNNVNVSSSADIDSGAGKLTVKNSTINDLDLDMGIGEVNITGEITGKSNIDYGIGSAKLNLSGKKNGYRIELDKGIGKANIDGSTLSDGEVYGDGENKINVDGGIGSLQITFTENI